MFEKMSKSGFSGFNLISRAGTDDEVMGNDVRIVKGNRDNFQPVIQHFDLVVVGENFRALEHRGNTQKKENGEESRDKFSHFLSSFKVFWFDLDY